MTSPGAHEPYLTPPAPVYTGLDDYYEPPRPPAERRPRTSPAWRATAALALVVAAWLLALAASQATSETVAVPFLGRTVSALGGVPALLELRDQQVRDVANRPGAAERIPVPGFPVPAVTLAREIAQRGTLDEWRTALLHDAGVAVYEQGAAAFTHDGVAAEGAGVFSSSRWVRLAMTLESSGTHRVALLLSWALGIGAIALGALVARTTDGARRFVAIGLGLLGGALLAAVASLAGLLAGWLIDLGAGSVFVEELGALVRAVAWMPIRLARWVALAGIAIAAPAAVAAVLLARLEDREARSDS